MKAVIGKTEYQVTEISPVDPELTGLIASLAERNLEPAFYTLTGKRGGVVVAYRSTVTLGFIKLW